MIDETKKADKADEFVTPKVTAKSKFKPTAVMGTAAEIAAIMADPDLAAIQTKPSAVMDDVPVATEVFADNTPAPAPEPSGPKLSKRTLAELKAGRESIANH